MCVWSPLSLQWLLNGFSAWRHRQHVAHLLNFRLDILVEICAARRISADHSSSSLASAVKCTRLGVAVVVVALPAAGDHLDALEDVNARSGHRLHFRRIIGQETNARCYRNS